MVALCVDALFCSIAYVEFVTLRHITRLNLNHYARVATFVRPGQRWLSICRHRIG